MGIMRKRTCRVPSMIPATTPRVFPSACMSDSSVNSVVVTIVSYVIGDVIAFAYLRRHFGPMGLGAVMRSFFVALALGPTRRSASADTRPASFMASI